MRCIIVDDDPLARSRLESLLKESKHRIEIVGQFGDAREAIPAIHVEKPDAVFVDIQMPVLDGFDLVDLLVPPKPAIIFVTAYDEYAIKAFDVRALDYLTKPVRLERLDRAIERVESGRASADAGSFDDDDFPRNHLSCLTTKVGSHLRVLQTEEISWIGSEDKLTMVSIGDRKFSVHFTLDELERRLDPKQFLRTHRSCLVNTRFVSELVPWFSGTYKIKLTDGTELPVARRRVKQLKKVMGLG